MHADRLSSARATTCACKAQDSGGARLACSVGSGRGVLREARAGEGVRKWDGDRPGRASTRGEGELPEGEAAAGVSAVWNGGAASGRLPAAPDYIPHLRQLPATTRKPTLLSTGDCRFNYAQNHMYTMLTAFMQTINCKLQDILK